MKLTDITNMSFQLLFDISRTLLRYLYLLSPHEHNEIHFLRYTKPFDYLHKIINTPGLSAYIGTRALHKKFQIW